METEDIPAHPEYTDLARRYAADVLRHHGVPNDLGPDGALHLDGRRVRIEWSAHDEGSQDGQCRVTLGCLIWSERYPEAPIETWLSGYGDHAPAAIVPGRGRWGRLARSSSRLHQRYALPARSSPGSTAPLSDANRKSTPIVSGTFLW